MRSILFSLCVFFGVALFIAPSFATTDYGIPSEGDEWGDPTETFFFSESSDDSPLFGRLAELAALASSFDTAPLALAASSRPVRDEPVHRVYKEQPAII